MATQIQVRRDTAANWTSANPTLAAGEIGFETDQNKFKIGTGSADWANLSYAGGSDFVLGNTLSNVNSISTEVGSNFSLTADGGTLTLGVDGATHTTLNKDGNARTVSTTDRVVADSYNTPVFTDSASGAITVDHLNGALQIITLTGDFGLSAIANTSAGDTGVVYFKVPANVDVAYDSATYGFGGFLLQNGNVDTVVNSLPGGGVISATKDAYFELKYKNIGDGTDVYVEPATGPIRGE